MALHWVRNKRTWKPYIQSRVNEVRKLTDSKCWNYCPGILNQADLRSRGLGARELVDSTLWRTRPEFIGREEVIPPTTPNIDFIASADFELAKTQPNLTHSLVAPTVPNQSGLATLINVDHYSSIETLLCVTAYVFRFVDALKGRCVDKESSVVTAEETKWAENI